MTDDAWLARWLPAIEARASAGPLLEVGCGAGHDTASLVQVGLRVVAFDISLELVQAARLRAPGAEIHCHSVLEGFPLEGTGVPVIVASLSLHYFSWPQTAQLFERLRQTQATDGLLLCRLNSTQDHHFGATGHPEIERRYHLVDGQPKRFFDHEDLYALFAQGWRIVSILQGHSRKYGATKAFWEVAAERAE